MEPPAQLVRGGGEVSFHHKLVLPDNGEYSVRSEGLLFRRSEDLTSRVNLNIAHPEVLEFKVSPVRVELSPSPETPVPGEEVTLTASFECGGQEYEVLNDWFKLAISGPNGELEPVDMIRKQASMPFLGTFLPLVGGTYTVTVNSEINKGKDPIKVQPLDPFVLKFATVTAVLSPSRDETLRIDKEAKGESRSVALRFGLSSTSPLKGVGESPLLIRVVCGSEWQTTAELQLLEGGSEFAGSFVPHCHGRHTLVTQLDVTPYEFPIEGGQPWEFDIQFVPFVRHSVPLQPQYLGALYAGNETTTEFTITNEAHFDVSLTALPDRGDLEATVVPSVLEPGETSRVSITFRVLPGAAEGNDEVYLELVADPDTAEVRPSKRVKVSFKVIPRLVLTDLQPVTQMGRMYPGDETSTQFYVTNSSDVAVDVAGATSLDRDFVIASAPLRIPVGETRSFGVQIKAKNDATVGVKQGKLELRADDPRFVVERKATEFDFEILEGNVAVATLLAPDAGFFTPGDERQWKIGLSNGDERFFPVVVRLTSNGPVEAWETSIMVREYAAYRELVIPLRLPAIADAGDYRARVHVSSPLNITISPAEISIPYTVPTGFQVWLDDNSLRVIVGTVLALSLALSVAWGRRAIQPRAWGTAEVGPPREPQLWRTKNLYRFNKRRVKIGAGPNDDIPVPGLNGDTATTYAVIVQDAQKRLPDVELMDGVNVLYEPDESRLTGTNPLHYGFGLKFTDQEADGLTLRWGQDRSRRALKLMLWASRYWRFLAFSGAIVALAIVANRITDFFVFGVL